MDNGSVSQQVEIYIILVWVTFLSVFTMVTSSLCGVSALSFQFTCSSSTDQQSVLNFLLHIYLALHRNILTSIHEH